MPARSAPATLTRVPGVRVGHAEDPHHRTGTTVVVFDRPVPTAVDIRGPASGTYDTASLSLDASFGRRDALFLSGGSLYGLDAARGVRTALLAAGRGEGAFASGFPLPRLSGGILFDLPRAPEPWPDYLPLGFVATESASSAPIEFGRVGAGTGARVGKYAGVGRSMPGGLASAAAYSRVDRGWIGILAVFNSVGAVRDPSSGRWLAGARGRTGKFDSPGAHWSADAGTRGTNLAIAVTNAPVDRRGLYRIAGGVHDGLAATVIPAHTVTEGDLVFASSTAADTSAVPGAQELLRRTDRLASLAASLVAECARRLFG
jgi:L-aminopeptidase/D-esterase-like protein